MQEIEARQVTSITIPDDKSRPARLFFMEGDRQ